MAERKVSGKFRVACVLVLLAGVLALVGFALAVLSNGLESLYDVLLMLLAFVLWGGALLSLFFIAVIFVSSWIIEPFRNQNQPTESSTIQQSDEAGSESTSNAKLRP